MDSEVLAAAGAGPLQIAFSQMTPPWDALCSVYARLGFNTAADDDDVFAHLLLARIIEPTSKADSLRVLGEAGIAVSYATLKRRLYSYADDAWRRGLATACAAQARLRWRSTMCPRCTSRPTPGTGSASPGSLRNAALSRRSRSGCSPPRGSR